jgi:hypothetical protein
MLSRQPMTSQPSQFEPHLCKHVAAKASRVVGIRNMVQPSHCFKYRLLSYLRAWHRCMSWLALPSSMHCLLPYPSDAATNTVVADAIGAECVTSGTAKISSDVEWVFVHVEEDEDAKPGSCRSGGLVGFLILQILLAVTLNW